MYACQQSTGLPKGYKKMSQEMIMLYNDKEVKANNLILKTRIGNRQSDRQT